MSPVSRVVDLLGELLAMASTSARDGSEVEALPGSELPEPARSLLVHERDMTSTLERWFGQSIVLKLLGSQEQNAVLSRRVVLVGEQDGRPTEFGAIRIHLDRFAEEPRRHIREAHLPLGRILQEFKVPYISAPTLYFACRGDRLGAQAFGIDGAPRLFGRHNVLRNPAGEALAEAVEILPPLDPHGDPHPP